MSSRTDSGARWHGPAVLATLAVAIVLRAIALDYGLWYDEIVTLVLSVRQPIGQILTEFIGVNAHPLYSVLAHVSVASFGESAWALRLPAALCGVASVAMVYVLAASFLPKVEAWVAAVVLATSYHHVWFSQNARGYTLMGFLTLVATHLLLRAGSSGSWRTYVAYALVAAAGVYTHLTMAFVVAAHAVVIVAGHLLKWRPALAVPLVPALAAWAGAAVVSAAAYAPFIPGIVRLMGLEETAQAAGVATGGWAVLEAIRGLLAGTGVPAAIAGGLVAAIGGLSALRRWPLVTALLVAPAFVTAIALVAAGQPLRPRFFFFLTAAAAVFVGRGVGVIADRIGQARVQPSTVRDRAAVILALALVALSAVALPTAYRVPKQDFEGAVAYAAEAETRGAVIAAAGPACLPIARYYEKTWSCLESQADWDRLGMSSTRALVVSTLEAYIVDARLRAHVVDDCRVLRRFPATLGGGTLTVCEVPRNPNVR